MADFGMVLVILKVISKGSEPHHCHPYVGIS